MKKSLQKMNFFTIFSTACEKRICSLLFVCLLSTSLFAQNTITGIVTDESNQPLTGASVVEKGTTNGVATGFDGKYAITVQGNATLVVSYVGYTPKEVVVGKSNKLNVKLVGVALLNAVQIVGSRNPKRTATDSPVPIDIIDVKNITSRTGKVELTQLLQYVVPSYNANEQSGADGADHIVPATLRGLGPDQTLVLINGKRRHESSLINLYGTRGRGNSGTDLNAIPASAIKSIEILRDGASAQYGSDAIAGVINIVLKDNVKGSGSISYGAYNTNAQGTFPAGTPNTKGFRLDTKKDGNAIGKDQNFDGGSIKFAANYGVKVGKDGFVNFTTEYTGKDKTLRPGYDFRRGSGTAAIKGFNFFVNSVIPISKNTEFYVFGGRDYRNTDAYAWTRNIPTARDVLSIYPNGFTPRITSIITDNSISAGVRTKTNSGWKIDFNNTFGANKFHYYIKGTLNASLGASSPTDFDAGGTYLSQNTTTIDFSKYYTHILSGLNLAFGTGYRTETFKIFAGEPGSYGTFDTEGLIIINPATQTVPIDPVTGNPRPGGSQGFPGYSPSNVVDRSRSNASLYFDSELDITKQLLLAGAIRYENYSDFGNTTNAKIATRLKLNHNFSLRGSFSTGFRAPSLAQIYYNLRFTDFQSGVASETLLSANNSPVTKAFGIQPLKQETSTNGGLGFAANFGSLNATVDGYLIKVRNRIILTGDFDASSLGLNVDQTQFFANGVDTKTLGLDVVVAWGTPLKKGKLNISLAGNFNDMTIDNIRNGNLDVNTFFGAREKGFLLNSAPKSKIIFDVNYQTARFSTDITTTHFSEVDLIDWANTQDIYKAKFVLDLNFGFKISSNSRIDIGGKNIFNTYPSIQTDGNTESGAYWDAVQMGFNGAFYYARLSFTF